MKKMKKFLAMFLAMAMVLGMSLTTFAATVTGKITVDNTVTYDKENPTVVKAQATLNMRQIIKANPETETGWEFVKEVNAVTQEVTFDAAAEFKKVDAFAGKNDQDILWMLILNADSSAELPEGKTITAAQAKDIEQALDNIVVPEQTPSPFSVDAGTNSQSATVTEIGVYAIKATEDGYNYNPMAAYVSFGKYDTPDGVPTTLVSEVLNAKKSPTSATKSSDEADDVVEVDKVVTYTITTQVPYITRITPKFTVQDVLQGAEYVVESDTLPGETEGTTIDNPNKGMLALTITVGNGQSKTVYVNVVNPYNFTDSEGKAAVGQSFTADLLNLVWNNSIDDENADVNKDLVITYKAKVTGLEVNNNATFNAGKDDQTWSGSDDLYTGSITITKTNEDGTENLPNAEFIVYSGTVNGTTVTPLKYALLEKATDKDGKEVADTFKVKGWVDTEDAVKAAVANGDAVNAKTGTDGTATVKGLDDSVSYFFKEVKAPVGYSINEADSAATWTDAGNSETAANRVGSASMVDTTLNSLPSTGGIGTTIFTIGGCVIMVAAAGLFFATRKKSSEK